MAANISEMANHSPCARQIVLNSSSKQELDQIAERYLLYWAF